MDDRRPAIILPRGWSDHRASRGYAENMAAAIVLAVLDERATGRIYNVAEPEGFSQAEWIRQIGQIVGWKGSVVVNPNEGIEPETVQHWVVDTSRIRQELGYAEPIRLQEALSRTIEWERANPPDAAFQERMAQFEPGLKFDYAAEDEILAELERTDSQADI
jgi:nucleoside-diphosphate-sugar epimerase